MRASFLPASYPMSEPKKAVSLISGGLDSMLATRVIQNQGIHVEGINFFTGFCVEGHTHAIRAKDKKKEKRNNALWVAEQLGIKLHIIDVIEEYKDVVLNPKHGYGANLNPCLDCKIFMVNKAHAWAAKSLASDPNHSAKRQCRSLPASLVQKTGYSGRCAQRTCPRPCRNAKAG
jgi:tRNA U34 2-thiouridine synthase MnmA/TrmU